MWTDFHYLPVPYSPFLRAGICDAVTNGDEYEYDVIALGFLFVISLEIIELSIKHLH